MVAVATSVSHCARSWERSPELGAQIVAGGEDGQPESGGVEQPTCRQRLDADPTEGRQQQGEQGRPSHQWATREIPPAFSCEEIHGRGQEPDGVPPDGRAVGGGADEDVRGAQDGEDDDEQRAGIAPKPGAGIGLHPPISSNSASQTVRSSLAIHWPTRMRPMG